MPENKKFVFKSYTFKKFELILAGFHKLGLRTNFEKDLTQKHEIEGLGCIFHEKLGQQAGPGIRRTDLLHQTRIQSPYATCRQSELTKRCRLALVHMTLSLDRPA